MSEYTPITRKPRGRSRPKDRRPLYSGGGGGELSPAAKKERALAQLDAEVEKVKAGTFLQAPVTAGGAIIDVLSRSEYAMAGAGEVLAGGGSLADAGRRMANEILSGLGPFKGEKRGATEVLERTGVPEGMHLSDTLKYGLLYSDTGEGIRLQRGGLLDPSARSGAGLFLSVVGDPLTYVGGVGALRKIGEKTLSTKGGKALTTAFVDATSDASTRAAAISTMKAADPALTSMAANAAMKRGQEAAPVLRDLAKAKAERDVLAAAAADPSLLDKGGIHFVTGHTIPGTQVLNPVFNAARQSYRKMANAWEGMGSLFFVGHRGRKFADFQKDLTAVKPAISDGVAKWETEISTAAKGFNLDDAAKKRVAIAVDEGKIGTLQGKEQAAATWIAQKKKQLLQAEWDAGIRVPAREHYLAHYYLNTPEELDRIKVRWGHKYGTAGDLGRHLEERSFDTYADAVRATTFQNSIDGTTPILKPLYDPFESLRRRSRKSVEARTWRAFEEIVATKHGRPPWVDGQTVNDLFDMSQRPTRVLNQTDATAVSDILSAPTKGMDKVKAVSRLQPNAKRAFFEDRIAKVTSRDELFNVMAKYEQFKAFFPKQKRVLGELAPDGSDYMTIAMKGLGDMDLPRPLADEVAALGKGLIEGKTPEGAALRKYILEPYDWIQNTFKLGVVAWPSFHFRNLYSNPAQVFADIGISLFNGRRRRDVAALLMGRDGVVKTTMGNYSLAELRPIFEKRGVIAPGANLFEYSGAIQPNQSWFTNKTKVRKVIENVQSAIGGTIENEARVMHALTILERTGSVDEAVAHVNKFLFDYSNMTEFERTYMKRLFPFWTWTSKNFMRQIENLRLRPGKLANEIKPVRGRSEEDEKLTTFEDGALKFRLDNDGKTLRVISGVDLPIRNMDLLWRGSAEKTGLGMIGMMSPALKVPMEQSFGVNAFTGRPMGRVKSEGLAGMLVQRMPKSWQLWLGYQDKRDAAGRPIMEFDERRFNLLFKSWATSRLVSTSDRMFREYINAFENNNNKAAIGATIDLLTGLRIKELNLDEQWSRRVTDRIRQSENALIRMGEKREGRYLFKPKPKPRSLE